MFIEFFIFIFSGALLGLFLGLAIFISIFYGMLHFFGKTNEDLSLFLAMMTLVIIVLSYYGFSFSNFIGSIQPGNKRVLEGIFFTFPFLIAHIAFFMCAFYGIRFCKHFIKKKFYGY